MTWPANAPTPLREKFGQLGSVQRLGKNISSYAGETIDIQGVLRDCAEAARAHGWRIEQIPVAPQTRLLACIGNPAGPAALPSGTSAGFQTSPAASERPLHVYISSGIHGDEPAGPLAVAQLLEANRWPAGVRFWICPCLNPAGFELNCRENADGLDLNRQYLQPKAAETLAHIAWLNQQPQFDLCLCLHEDWEAHGFYVYELNPEDRPSLARGIVEAVAEVCPIDRSEIIEGRPARDGIIRPSVDPRSRPQWPESFYLLTSKTRLAYTLEAPSDFPLPVRVAALTAAVNCALDQLTHPPGRPGSAG